MPTRERQGPDASCQQGWIIPIFTDEVISNLEKFAFMPKVTQLGLHPGSGALPPLT